MTTRFILRTQALEWLARDDLEGQLVSEDIAIFMAEATIARRVRLRDQETSIELSATARSTPLPDNYLSMRSVALNTTLGRSIDYLTPERIRESPIWLNQGFRNEEDNVASAYTIEGNNIILAPAPTPEAPTPLLITYYRRYDGLVSNTDTNSLLQNHFDIYLYAYLNALATYLQETDIADRYERMFEKAVAEVTRSERWGRFSGSALISTGNPRRTV